MQVNRQPTHYSTPGPRINVKSNQLASCQHHPDPQKQPPPSFHSTRRSLLTGVSVGGLHAMAVRTILPYPVLASSSAIGSRISSSEMLLQQIEQRVQEFTLSNGMKFIVSRRDNTAPVVSCHTYANVGAFDEVDGQTGIAHLLEHLAFKGTVEIGTTNYEKEALILSEIDDVFYSILQAQQQGSSNGKELARLNQQFETLQTEAAKYSVANAFGQMLEQQGAVGLNAATSHDATKYYCSLPTNKLELWFALESQRFQFPVFRELYTEKKVVTEERRMRVDNSPLGPFQEEYSRACLGNNYGRPVIGYQSDIDRIGRRDIEQFFKSRYGPESITISIAGNVKPETVRMYAEKYFGNWQNGIIPAKACSGGNDNVDNNSRTSLLYQNNDKDDEPLALPADFSTTSSHRYDAKSRAGPLLMRSFYRPCTRNKDSLPLEVASDLLSGTRLSRLYKNLVLRNKALTATSVSGLPGEKHPSTFLVYGIPLPGNSLEQLDAAIFEELDDLATKGPTEEELSRVVKSTRVSLLKVLTSNSTLAGALASYEVLTGDWKNVVRDLKRLEELKPEGVREVAGKYLQRENSFAGYVQKA